MGEVLPISTPLERIAATFIERKWMRAAKAWRCFIALPHHQTLPSMLTGLIDEKVYVDIEGPVNIIIDPAFVVDVPSKGKKFLLVIETCYENQAALGPLLTALTDSAIILTISKHKPQLVPAPVNSSPLTTEEMRGLHLGFFRNERFWEYVEHHPNSGCINPITTEAEAKTFFKKIMNVASCKDIPRERFVEFVGRFNEWLAGRSRA